MKNINDLLKIDKNNIKYIDYGSVELKRKKFPEVGKDYEERRLFYLINGIDNYIIKSCEDFPLLFNRRANMKLLRKLIEKQELLPDIGFPIGYLNDENGIKGTIIPYYKDAESLNKLVYLCSLDTLKENYNHQDNEIDNLISLFLDVLDIIHRMYKNGVIYTDIRPANFVLYNNNVKIIDFDPGFLSFKDRTKFYYKTILRNYGLFVHGICRRYKFNDILFPTSEDFVDAELSTKSLRKVLKR